MMQRHDKSPLMQKCLPPLSQGVAVDSPQLFTVRRLHEVLYRRSHTIKPTGATPAHTAETQPESRCAHGTNKTVVINNGWISFYKAHLNPSLSHTSTPCRFPHTTSDHTVKITFLNLSLNAVVGGQQLQSCRL